MIQTDIGDLLVLLISTFLLSHIDMD